MKVIDQFLMKVKADITQNAIFTILFEKASSGLKLYGKDWIFDEIFRKICEADSQTAIFEQFFLKRSRKGGLFELALISFFK